VPGRPYCGQTSDACKGVGVTFDASGNITAYLEIPDGNGVFAQAPTRIADITDGLSNTAAFSETLLGNGAVPSAAPTDPQQARLALYKVTGSGDPVPSVCDAGSPGTGGWAGDRGAQWINGHYGHTLYNHYYPPNVSGKWDCGQASGAKGLTAARSNHPG